MLKKTYLILLVCFCCNQSYGQSYFNRLYDYDGSHLYNNAAKSSYEFPNGDFLINGQKYPSFSFGGLVFYRINTLGDTILTKKYPRLNHYYYTGTSGSLIRCNDNNFAQSGILYDSASTIPDALLIKFTENADTLWTKSFGGLNNDVANIVCQTLDSGYVLMGSSNSFNTNQDADFYLVKTDKYGNEQWHRTYGSTLAENCISGQITLDGGYIMSGQRQINSTSTIFYVIKTDNLGNVQWQKTYPTSAGACFIKQLPDSTYILAGAKPFGATYKPSLIKTDKNGTVIWQNYYSDYGSLFYSRPIILYDGSVVVSGLYLTASGNGYGLLIKTDSAGNQQWLHTYYANPSNDNYVYDVKHTSDGGFILTGSGNVGGQDAWVVKVDSVGCEIANCNVGVEEAVMDKEEIKVYPNPATNSLTLTLIKGEGMQSVKIYNVLGELVYQSEIKNNATTFTINLEEASTSSSPWGRLGGAGLYVLEVQTEKGTIRKKFVKE